MSHNAVDGKAIISFSNRYFPSKAIDVWLSHNSIGRLSIVGSYFHHSEEWKVIEPFDMQQKKELLEMIWTVILLS